MLDISEINSLCDQFTEESGIGVTDGARAQIAVLINSVESDPQERWSASSEQLNNHFARWRETLPELLPRVAHDHYLTMRISTMDVVYWTASHLDSVWPKDCPFGRPDEYPGLANIKKSITEAYQRMKQQETSDA